MQTCERLTVATPEDIEVTVTLSGIGSRFAAALIDLLIQIVLILVLIFATIFVFQLVLPGGTSEVAGAVVVAIVLLLSTAVFLLYHLVLEAVWRGKTIGKAALRIHVERDGGLPLTTSAVVIRNFLRLVDFLPLFYGVGLVSVLFSRHRKRLGDHVGGTIVVTDPKPESGTGMIFVTPRSYGTYEHWDVSGVTDDDELLVRRFLDRRTTLRPSARSALAYRIAMYVHPKVMGAEGAGPPEYFLEGVALATAGRRTRWLPPSLAGSGRGHPHPQATPPLPGYGPQPLRTPSPGFPA